MGDGKMNNNVLKNVSNYDLFYIFFGLFIIGCVFSIINFLFGMGLILGAGLGFALSYILRKTKIL